MEARGEIGGVAEALGKEMMGGGIGRRKAGRETTTAEEARSRSRERRVARERVAAGALGQHP